MYRNLCCCIFTYDDKYEIYGRNNQNPNDIQGLHGSYYNQFVLNGIGDLPNEIIVEFLFPYLDCIKKREKKMIVMKLKLSVFNPMHRDVF